MDFAGLKTRFEGSLPGEIAVELVRIEVVECSIALASKLFVAVIPLSIIISAVVRSGQLRRQPGQSPRAHGRRGRGDT